MKLNTTVVPGGCRVTETTRAFYKRAARVNRLVQQEQILDEHEEERRCGTWESSRGWTSDRWGDQARVDLVDFGRCVREHIPVEMQQAVGKNVDADGRNRHRQLKPCFV